MSRLGSRSEALDQLRKTLSKGVPTVTSHLQQRLCKTHDIPIGQRGLINTVSSAEFKKMSCLFRFWSLFCFNWHSTASRWDWRTRTWRGRWSATTCLWRSRRSSRGFWSWAGTSVSSVSCALAPRSCPDCDVPTPARSWASCTGLRPRCRRSWRTSCACRWGSWSWSRSCPPRCGFPESWGGCFPGSRPLESDAGPRTDWTVSCSYLNPPTTWVYRIYCGHYWPFAPAQPVSSASGVRGRRRCSWQMRIRAAPGRRTRSSPSGTCLWPWRTGS